MYSESEEIIRARILRNMSDNVDKTEGYLAYDSAAALSKEFSSNKTILDQILTYAFPQTSNGIYLDYIAGSHGITRKPGSHATTQIIFLGTNGTKIAAGTIMQTSSGLQFETTEDLQIVNSTITTTVIAKEIGLAYNVPANVITQLVVQIQGITGITNTNAATNGADQETDQELLTRLLEKVQNPPGSGNVGDYKRWAKEVTGVEYAKVVPLWNGNGTVKIVVSGVNGLPVDATVIQAVKTHIDPQDGKGGGTAPIGASVTIVTDTTLTIDIIITGLTITTDYILATVKTNIQTTINNYLNLLHPGDIIKYNQIYALIATTDGVSDFLSIKINNSTINITTTDEQKAILGTTTYN